jgi:hypothetical protein
MYYHLWVVKCNQKKAEIDHKQVINCLIESSQETSEPGSSREEPRLSGVNLQV